MKYPDSEGSIWLRVQHAYDQCAKLLQAEGMRGLITYPKLTGRPAYALEHLEPIELDMQDYSAGNRDRIERTLVERNVKAVVFRDVPPSDVDLALLKKHGVRSIDYVIGGFRPDFRISPIKRCVNMIRAWTGWQHHDMYVPNSMDGFEVLTQRLGFPRSRIQTICNGVDIDRFAPGPRPDPAQWGLPVTDHYALMVCQARAEKRVDHMITAAANIFQKRPELSLTFIHVGGGGLLNDWKKQAADLGVADRFHFMDRQDDPAPFYRLASVMLHLSEFEAFGNVCLEAMSSGKPVICSDIGGPRELINHGQTGYLLPIHDVNAFAEHIMKLIDDDALRDRMGQAGRERAVNEYSIQREVEAFHALLKNQMIKAG